MYLDEKSPLAPYEKQIDIKDRKYLVAKILKGLRNTKGYLQKDVAEMIGIPTPTYSGYESAKTEAPIEILVRLSFLYDVPIDFLVGREMFSIDFDEQLQSQIDDLKNAFDKIGGELLSGQLMADENTQQFASMFLNAMKDLTRAMEETNQINMKKSGK
ncbi:MAG: helix-turn-helix transcriptional regulator [Oscillospiraceae bacterium]|nr:helix-turn-helix transcriptional regulator [Oscillospiraceae bacterium]